ncbi:TPA: hypothetical protein QFP58_002454, partial [Enterococcus faecium]
FERLNTFKIGRGHAKEYIAWPLFELFCHIRASFLLIYYFYDFLAEIYFISDFIKKYRWDLSLDIFSQYIKKLCG